MKNLSLAVIIGILFSAIGTTTLIIFREALTAAIWLSFGNGLLVSNLRLKGVDEQGRQFVKPIPRIRVNIGLFLIVLAVMLLFLQVYLDLKQ
ncbi:hypothetical protein [Pontibacter sp. SGAir0037]|uniref:hypothetical protein n=1 Tax=Pontibacter sp. SGAir0037 TaxID=2571030 RepID=UPI0010CD495A|nr:hypothetical protein [Pontibacter sp. SGAir0037]QCR21974.1 hypothetical protein C1N53_06245 [Pontibacter sp. SGAir0037]